MKSKYQNDLGYQACTPSGAGPVESQEHIEKCPAYAHLRRDIDISYCENDRVQYYKKVLIIRTKRTLSRRV